MNELHQAERERLLPGDHARANLSSKPRFYQPFLSGLRPYCMRVDLLFPTWRRVLFAQYGAVCTVIRRATVRWRRVMTAD